MSISFSLYKPHLPPSSKPNYVSSSVYGSNFSHVTTKLSTLTVSSTRPRTPTSTSFPVIKCMKKLEGRVVGATNDKTVKVLVTRIAPEPKYTKRVRKQKKYQAHDPENKFKVGDWVQLEKCQPISKTKTFLAIAPTDRRNAPKAAEEMPAELGLPLESKQ